MLECGHVLAGLAELAFLHALADIPAVDVTKLFFFSVNDIIVQARNLRSGTMGLYYKTIKTGAYPRVEHLKGASLG